jgi:uncharacterized protein
VPAVAGLLCEEERLSWSFFRLTDLTMLKVMMGGILSGMVAVYALRSLDLVNLHIKPTVLAANVLGGLVFGAGMLLLGF